ncbi:MAG: PQQ-dependent sugar dehydrogenase [Pseudomonadota bacterium]
MSLQSLRRWRAICLLLLGAAGLLALAGCYEVRKSAGGGQTDFTPPRVIRAADVAVPPGYRVEPVATGLTFPSAVVFDDANRLYVVEAGYSYGEAWATPRLLRLEPDGRQSVVAVGKNPPWTGVSFHQGAFYIAEGGHLGRILRVTLDGRITPLAEGLPSLGDHHTNRPVVGPDGWLYFSQGTVTNAAVVGPDNAEFGWLKRYPDFHDIPCRDVTLAGRNFESDNPLTADPEDRVSTGAFSSFGTRTAPGQVIRGRVPCSGAIMRVSLAGGQPELVAWGLRNPFGLAFAPDGRLFTTENAFDNRGSRPVFAAPDVLWAVVPGTWYGWPDFAGGMPVTDPRFKPRGKAQPRFLLARHPNRPPRPAALLGVHSSSNGLDFSRNPAFGYVGQAFIAQFGDMAPNVDKVLHPVGFKVVRVDVNKGVIEDFLVNRGKQNGPASRIGGAGIERPVDVRFDQAGTALYVVDFGVMTMGRHGPEPRPGTGVLWRVVRDAGQ